MIRALTASIGMCLTILLSGAVIGLTHYEPHVEMFCLSTSVLVCSYLLLWLLGYKIVRS